MVQVGHGSEEVGLLRHIVVAVFLLQLLAGLEEDLTPVPRGAEEATRRVVTGTGFSFSFKTPKGRDAKITTHSEKHTEKNMWVLGWMFSGVPQKTKQKTQFLTFLGRFLFNRKIGGGQVFSLHPPLFFRKTHPPKSLPQPQRGSTPNRSLSLNKHPADIDKQPKPNNHTHTNPSVQG